MKNIGYIVLLLLALPFTGIAQNDSAIVDNKETPNFNNQMDLDVHILAGEITYKRRVAKRMFVGISLGLGPMFRMNGQETFLEEIKFKGFIYYQFSNKFHIFLGGAYAGTYSYSADDTGLSISIELGFFYVMGNIEFGIEPSLIFFKQGFSDRATYESGKMTTSLIVIKIPLKRW